MGGGDDLVRAIWGLFAAVFPWKSTGVGFYVHIKHQPTLGEIISNIFQGDVQNPQKRDMDTNGYQALNLSRFNFFRPRPAQPKSQRFHVLWHFVQSITRNDQQLLGQQNGVFKSHEDDVFLNHWLFKTRNFSEISPFFDHFPGPKSMASMDPRWSRWSKKRQTLQKSQVSRSGSCDEKDGVLLHDLQIRDGRTVHDRQAVAVHHILAVRHVCRCLASGLGDCSDPKHSYYPLVIVINSDQ